MKKLLRITLTTNEKIFAKSSHINLEPFAPTTARRFTFENLKVVSGVKIEYHSILKVNIYHSCKYSNIKQGMYEFKIFVLDYKENSNNNWHVYGLIYDDYYEEYRQGVIDVFNLWQHGKEFNWFELPINSYLKEDYIRACLFYSSVSKIIIEGRDYQIDASLIQEFNDFLYLISIEFFGDRGYMGHSLHSFKDCLLELKRNGVILNNRKIKFLNTGRILSTEIGSLLEEIKSIFLRFNFYVENL